MTTRYFVVTDRTDSVEYLIADTSSVSSALIADSLGGNVFTYDTLRDARMHDADTRSMQITDAERARMVARCCG